MNEDLFFDGLGGSPTQAPPQGEFLMTEFLAGDQIPDFFT